MWLPIVRRVIEGFSRFAVVPWGEDELYYALTPNLTGEAATWASTFHASLKSQDKRVRQLEGEIVAAIYPSRVQHGSISASSHEIEKAHEIYDNYAAALQFLGSGVDIPDNLYAGTFIKGLASMAGGILPARRAKGPIDNTAVMVASIVAKDIENKPIRDGLLWNPIDSGGIRGTIATKMRGSKLKEG